MRWEINTGLDVSIVIVYTFPLLAYCMPIQRQKKKRVNCVPIISSKKRREWVDVKLERN